MRSASPSRRRMSSFATSACLARRSSWGMPLSARATTSSMYRASVAWASDGSKPWVEIRVAAGSNWRRRAFRLAVMRRS